MIELTNLSKQFGRRRAVEELTLAVPKGEIFGLLGHNGAGKSTAIGMMLGQVWPTTGTVRICGHDVTSDRRRALHGVGAIFESPVFYDYLSGRRNLEVLSSYSATTPKSRISEVIEWVGLKGREHSKVRTYSHGMRARLAVAQALLPAPELLILDEASDGLDPEGIHEMRQTIQRLHRELGLTILLSSHLLNEVEQLCTRIAVMNKGRKVFEGSVESATRRLGLVRIVAGNPTQAREQLEGAGLILRENAPLSPPIVAPPFAKATAARGFLASLAAHATTAQVARHLVTQGFDLHEIAIVEQTLEDFYLSLMNDERA
jgi:ABC-2 type transport system ATP-binding protein